MTDKFFERVYNPKILTELEAEFGPFARQHVGLSVATEAMHTMVDKMRRSKKPRRAEVVLVVPNEAGDIWLHTKAFYPAGTYRLMTGGVEAGESPALAALRETHEETGFAVKLERCLGVITYRFFNEASPLPFASYLFLTTPSHGQPAPTDPAENISDFVAVPAAELTKTARQLRLLEGRLADWGIFRAIAHELAAVELAK